jgi:hypothetical protein
VDEFTPVPPSSAEETKRRISEPPDDPDTTQRSRALEILASIADRALEAARLQDAEDLLKTTLLDLLQEASLGHQIEPDSLEFALTYSLRLAESLGKSRWFDYAIDLLKSQRQPCSAAVATSLKRVVVKLPMVDVERLQNYAAMLRHASSSMEHFNSADRVEAVLAEAMKKRAP